MFLIKLRLVIVFVFILTVATDAQRRIKSGAIVNAEKNYVVYLLKAPVSPQKYDAWVCGGALVSPVFIVTSAACVEDVQHLYAIAGYKKYIPYEKIQLDPCTREKKKKVIFICVPKDYDLDYARLEKWSNIDIAVAKVESPYDFHDLSYDQLCSYKPGMIAVNYDPKYQEPGIDTLVYGWGHTELWRNPTDGMNHNQEDLHYATALIQDKKDCKPHYQKFNGMGAIIDKYMICTLEPGNFNDAGELLKQNKGHELLQGCVTRIQRMKGMRGVPCYEPYYREGINYGDDIFDETRRNGFIMNQNNYRRNGICQNDHGGPLVTWVGSRELLIGVASVFRVDNESKCAGPYLYTSTQCNGAFLDCILNSKDGRRDSCDVSPAQNGFHLIERQISWVGHPDGPADNEIGQPPKQYLRGQPDSEQETLEKQFSDLLLPEEESMKEESAEQQSLELSLQEHRFRTQQIPEQQIPEQQLPEQELPEKQLRERQLPEQQLPEQKMSDQQWMDIQLDELLPGLHLSGRQSEEQQLPEQKPEEQQLPQLEIQRPSYSFGPPSEEQFY